MSRFTRKNHGSSHSYLLDGAPIPGVTSVIGILDKPALVKWAASETAAYADEHWAELQARGGVAALREWLSSRRRVPFRS